MKVERSTATDDWLRRALVRLMLLAAALVGGHPTATSAAGAIIPRGGTQFDSRAQLVLVRVDPSRALVEVVGNVRFSGRAETFAVIVPTPADPVRIEILEHYLWSQAGSLTAGYRRVGSSVKAKGLSCTAVTDPDLRYELDTGWFADPIDGDLFRTAAQTVSLEVTAVFRADTTATVVEWLIEGGYDLDALQADVLNGLRGQGWAFTVLSPVDAVPQGPDGIWDADIVPVVVTYPGATFELALPVMALHRHIRLPVAVVIVADHRQQFAGFATTYANSVNHDEFTAIAAQAPLLSSFLGPGCFVTRLDRTFVEDRSMDQPLLSEPAPTNAEFRLVIGAAPSVPGGLLLLAAPLVLESLHRWRRRHR